MQDNETSLLAGGTGVPHGWMRMRHCWPNSMCMQNRAWLGMTKRTRVIHRSSSQYKTAKGWAREDEATLLLPWCCSHWRQTMPQSRLKELTLICFLALVWKSSRSGLQKVSMLGTCCWPVLFLWGHPFCLTLPHDVHRLSHQELDT